MDAAWIQVFVLTLSECVAPAGKTVCQENTIEMQFLSEAECEVALEQLVTLKDQFENVIVNRNKSGCAPSARKSTTYASLDDAKSAARDSDKWREPESGDSIIAASKQSHDERLADLESCDDTLGVAPCKIGDIIIEGASSGRPVEVWRKDR